MGKKEEYYLLAKKYYVEDQQPISSVGKRLNITEKTLHGWKREGDWEKERKKFLSSQYNCYSSLYELLNRVTNAALDTHSTTGELPDKATLDFIKAMADKLPKVKRMEDTLLEAKTVELEEIETDNQDKTKDLNNSVIEEISKYLRGTA